MLLRERSSMLARTQRHKREKQKEGAPGPFLLESNMFHWATRAVQVRMVHCNS